MRFVDYLVLPPEITDFERSYLRRVNRVALGFFALHVPVFGAIAWLNGTNPLLALALTSFVALGPWLALSTLSNPRHVSNVMGVTAMAMGGLLVNFGRGAMTIEMHFYFFVLLALLSVFANPMPILVAAVTVAAHHAILWATLPVAVFNYDAPFSAVAVHALFVVLESIAAVFVARSFFDNVIGLDRIVQARTAALDDRNRELSIILDNIGQGFVRLDRSGVVPGERSRILDEWLGAPTPGQTWMNWVGRVDASVGEWLEVGWDSLFDDLLPFDIAVDQLPKSLHIGDRFLSFEYRPVGSPARGGTVLVVVSDVSSERERQRANEERNEILTIVERILRDRSGFMNFLTETARLLESVNGTSPRPDLLRALHTLKGNFALFGVHSLARRSHELENDVLETEALEEVDLGALALEWNSFLSRLGGILEAGGDDIVEITRPEYDSLRSALRGGELDAGALLLRLDRYLKEPAQKRLDLLAEQARALAARFEKGDVEVVVVGGDKRLPGRRFSPLWAALVHVVRNAIDHGIESPRERQQAGKEERPRIVLSVRDEAGTIELSIADNGRGIDFERVRSRAQLAGIPSHSQEDLKRALFHEGLTTRDEATDISGRGVGMNAVLREVEALGGTITVESSEGVGTTFRLRVPDRSTYAPLAAE